MTDRQAIVKNAGIYSGYFYLERGVRQGCPISLMLFIMAVEMLAINIRQDNNISGVKIANSAPSIKILQYADDTTLFLRNETDFREVLAQIKKFSLFSGLQLNENKYNAMILSNTLAQTEKNGNIRCVDKIKILGIHFSSLYSAGEIENNWKGRLEKIEKNAVFMGKKRFIYYRKKYYFKNANLKQNELHHQ